MGELCRHTIVKTVAPCIVLLYDVDVIYKDIPAQIHCSFRLIDSLII
jgi:hypothetical protein